MVQFRIMHRLPLPPHLYILPLKFPLKFRPSLQSCRHLPPFYVLSHGNCRSAPRMASRLPSKCLSPTGAPNRQKFHMPFPDILIRAVGWCDI